jgi:hypothetical protein
MNIRTALILGMTMVFSLPAFGNGPGMTDTPMTNGGGTTTNNGGGRQMSPGRDQWTRRRIKHLRRQMDDYKKAQRASDNLGYATGEYVPQIHRNPAEYRQHLINRYEFLALKAERGKATSNDIAEMHAIKHRLLGH